MSGAACYFKFKFDCQGKNEKILRCGIGRIRNVVKCSKIYGDGKYVELDELMEGDSMTCAISSHKSCVCSYTSPEKLKRHMKSVNESETTSAPRKRTRLMVKEFSFQYQCLFCGEECSVDKSKDPKNPHRWKRAF